MPLFIGLLMTLVQAPARAQDDPPGRVGRLANLQGEVWWFDHEEGQWAAAERNRPLTQGDRVSTGPSGRVELRVGSSALRLAPLSELEVLRLDDERMVWQLHSGAVALRLRTREAAEETELLTREVRIQPERAGHYRLDRIDDTTLAGAWRGSLRVLDGNSAGSVRFVIETGQRVELWREGNSRFDAATTLRQRSSVLPNDEFASWVLAEDRQDDRSTAYRYVSPEMTGAEELDRHGRWEQHPEYGAMWIPTAVAADWAPYRHGRWAWVQPWGWTWVDEARWGFAPFHYGRWVSWRGRWAWCPGTYVARPVFAPALVAWVGGPRLGVSISIGLPAVAWVPLAPREVYVPTYRHSPVYVDRVNVHPPRWQRPQPDRGPHHSGAGPVVYGNQGVPGGVTVVPRDVLLQRQPVARAVVDGRPGGPGAGHQGPADRYGPARPDNWHGPGVWERVAPPTAPLASERAQRPAPQAGQEDRTDRRPPRPEWREPVNPPQPLPHGQGPMAPHAPNAPLQTPRGLPAQPPTEPAAPPPRADNPRRDRDAEQRPGPDRPAWNMGPQRPEPRAPQAGPAAPVQVAPAVAAPQPAPRAQPQRPAAPPPAPAPMPAPQPARAEAPAAAPAAVTTAPAPVVRAGPPAPAVQAGPERPRDARPERTEKVDAEEGRKRIPDNRGRGPDREREAVR